MPTLNFTSFHGAVPRGQHYDLSAYGDILYIVPDDVQTARRYDPFADSDGLLLDVVRAGAVVASCDTLFEYGLQHGMMPLQDSDLWRYGDFFIQNFDVAQPVVNTILSFVERYGLPAWETVSTLYPARYERQMREKNGADSNEREAQDYLIKYESVKRACQKSGSVPVYTLALIFLDFYLQFMEGISDRQFIIRNTEWMMDYRHEKTPGLIAQVHDLTTCINLAYAMLVSGDGKAIRQCKNCGKFFIAEDLRAEYCSPRCRGAYNSKMTRKRVKERKLREGQQIKNEGG